MSRKIARTSDEVWMDLCDHAEAYCRQNGMEYETVQEAVEDYFYADTKAFFDILYGIADGNLDFVDFDRWVPSICAGVKEELMQRIPQDDFRSAKKRPKKYARKKDAQVADIVSYENDEFGTYFTLEDGGKVDVFETSDCDYVWEYYNASGSLVDSSDRFETEDEAIDNALDVLRCSYKDAQKKKADYQWPQVDEFVDRALDIEKNQFRNWSSIDEVREDPDVENLAETMELDDETFAEGCRRVFEEAPIWDKPAAKKSATKKIVNKVKRAFSQPKKTAEEQVQGHSYEGLTEDGSAEVYMGYPFTVYKSVDSGKWVGVMQDEFCTIKSWGCNCDTWQEAEQYARTHKPDSVFSL